MIEFGMRNAELKVSAMRRTFGRFVFCEYPSHTEKYRTITGYRKSS